MTRTLPKLYKRRTEKLKLKEKKLKSITTALQFIKKEDKF